MLELGRTGAVGGGDGPAVSQGADAGFADVNHRFNGEDHAGANLDARAGLAKVLHLWLFPKGVADAMPDKIAYNGKALAFGVGLDGCADVAEMIVGAGLLDAELQAATGGVNELLGFGVYCAD